MIQHANSDLYKEGYHAGLRDALPGGWKAAPPIMTAAMAQAFTDALRDGKPTWPAVLEAMPSPDAAGDPALYMRTPAPQSKCFAMDGKTPIYAVHGLGVMVKASDFNVLWQARAALTAEKVAAEPVMWVILDRDGDLIAQSMTEIKGLDWQPLYATPQQPAQSAEQDERAAYLVRGLDGYNEEYASVWIKRANADAAAARIFRASITPLVEARAASPQSTATQPLKDLALQLARETFIMNSIDVPRVIEKIDEALCSDPQPAQTQVAPTEVGFVVHDDVQGWHFAPTVAWTYLGKGRALYARAVQPATAEQYRCKRCDVMITAGEKLTCGRGPCPMELIEQAKGDPA